MTPYWRGLSSNPMLIAKLVLVLLLAAMVGIVSAHARKAKQGQADIYLKKIEGLGRITLLIGLAIVILAVAVFH